VKEHTLLLLNFNFRVCYTDSKLNITETENEIHISLSYQNVNLHSKFASIRI